MADARTTMEVFEKYEIFDYQEQRRLLTAANQANQVDRNRKSMLKKGVSSSTLSQPAGPAWPAKYCAALAELRVIRHAEEKKRKSVNSLKCYHRKQAKIMENSKIAAYSNIVVMDAKTASDPDNAVVDDDSFIETLLSLDELIDVAPAADIPIGAAVATAVDTIIAEKRDVGAAALNGDDIDAEAFLSDCDPDFITELLHHIDGSEREQTIPDFDEIMGQCEGLGLPDWEGDFWLP
jgi:hypothetical protein